MSEVRFKQGFIFLATINACMGSFFWSYTTIIFDSVEYYLQSYVFPTASDATFSLIVSAPYLGGIGGAFLVGIISQKFGRWFTMLCLNILAIVGVIFTLFPILPLLILGRLLQGVVLGAEWVIALMYIAELAPPELIGILSAVNMLMTSLAQQMAYGLGFAMPTTPDSGNPDMWRVLFGLAIIPNILRIVGLLFFFKFDTPLFTAIQEKEEETKKTLSKLYYPDFIDKEYRRIEHEKKQLLMSAKMSPMEFKDLFGQKYRKAFFVCCVLALALSFSGFNNIFYFSNDMILDAENDPTSEIPYIFSTIMGFLDLISSVAGLFISMKVGRKTALLIGYGGCALVNLLYGIIGLNNRHSPALKFLILCFPPLFTPFIAITTTIYYAEILPDVALSVLTILINLLSFLIDEFYLTIAAAITPAGWELFEGLFLVVCFGVLMIYMIESFGKSKTEIIVKYSGITLQKLQTMRKLRTMIDRGETIKDEDLDSPTDRELMLKSRKNIDSKNSIDSHKLPSQLPSINHADNFSAAFSKFEKGHQSPRNQGSFKDFSPKHFKDFTPIHHGSINLPEKDEIKEEEEEEDEAPQALATEHNKDDLQARMDTEAPMITETSEQFPKIKFLKPFKSMVTLKDHKKPKASQILPMDDNTPKAPKDFRKTKTMMKKASRLDVEKDIFKDNMTLEEYIQQRREKKINDAKKHSVLRGITHTPAAAMRSRFAFARYQTKMVHTEEEGEDEEDI